MKNFRFLFPQSIFILAGLLFVLPPGTQAEKATLFQEKGSAPPKAIKERKPAAAGKTNVKPDAGKSKVRINPEQEKRFVKNLKEGIKAFQDGAFEASITFLEKALIMIDFLPHRKGSAKTVYKLLAQATYKLQDYEKSVHYQNQVVKSILAEGGKADEDELAIENRSLGAYFSLAKDNAAAAEYLKKALEHYTEYEYDDKSAEIYDQLGKVYEKDLKYGMALWAYQKAFRLYRKIEDMRSTGVALRRIGTILRNQFYKFSESEKYFTEANRVFLKAGNAEMAAETFLELGLAAEKIPDFDKAMQLYRKGQALAEENNLPLTLSKALLRQGNIHWFHGDRQKSFKSLKSALQAAEAKGDARQQALIFNTIGLIYKDMDDIPSSLSYLEKSLRLTREMKSPIDEGSSLSAIGLVYRQDKNHRKSVEYFKKALEIDERLESKQGQSYSHRRLAISYRLTDNFRESDFHISKAIELSRETGDEANLAESLREKLTLVVLQNKTVEMKSLYRELETLVKKIFGEKHPDLANLYNYKALQNAGRGHYSSALDYFKKEMAIQENQIRNIFAIATEKQKLDFIQSVTGSYELGLSLIHQNFSNNPKAVRAGLELTLRRKGIIIDAQSKAREALRKRLTPEAQKDWDRAASLRSQLSHLMLNKPRQAPHEEYLKAIASLRKQIRKTETILAQKSPLAANELKQGKITAQAVAEKLPENAALVEFVKFSDYDFDSARWGDKRYIAFVLRKSGEVKLIDLGMAISLERQAKEALNDIRSLKKITRNTIGKSRASMKTLYQKLWEPLESAMTGIDIVFISPDGLANLAPFAALIDRGGELLIERFILAYLTSGRDLIGPENADSLPGSELLLLANPAYDRGSAASVSNAAAVRSRIFNNPFKPVHGSRAEAVAIPPLIAGPPEKKTVLVGEAASESAVKNTSSPKILHLAARCFFLTQDETAPAPPGRYENPLLKSGLAFAGANYANEVTFGDDGILTALEISGMALHGTHLAVLSACDTGTGKTQTGEGVYALRRAFALAGAKNLLLSLWPISDEATIIQMTDFYKHLRSMSPTEALRQAQLDTIGNLRKKYNGAAPPALWAPFILQAAGAMQN